MITQLHSIISPVYESKETLEQLVKKVSDSLNNAGIRFELILVDDGSKDGSFEEIKRLSKIYPHIKGVKLSRNFGHQAALTIGLKKSRGDYIAIIDDDLQDPPDILPDFFKRLYEEADVVYGVRRKRKEGLMKKFFYASFYRVLRILSNIEIPLDTGDFCAMKRCVVDAMLDFKDANPFLRGIRSWVGFKQVGVEYQRSSRFQGESGYTIRKYFSLAISGILSFSYIPLRLATYIGILAALAGFLFAAYVIYLWLYKPFGVPGYASLVVLVTFFGGVQLVTIGILGEYIARLSDNVRNPGVAVVAEITFNEIA